MISFEALFDALRAEKSREELQAMDKDFYKNTALYIKDKQDFVKYKANQVLTSEEFEKEQQQLANIKHIIRDLYDRRITKISMLALNASRISPDMVDMNLLLKEEKPLFQMLFKVFKLSRDNVLKPMLSGSIINTNSFSSNPLSKSDSNSHPFYPLVDKHRLNDNTATAITDNTNVKTSIAQESKPLIMVRFVREVPRFSDREGNILGPFDVNDVAALPKYIADLLISKGRAEVFIE